MLGLLMLASNAYAQAAFNVVELRRTTPLNENWEFIQDDNLTNQQALTASGNDWQTVTLPHTFSGGNYESNTNSQVW